MCVGVICRDCPARAIAERARNIFIYARREKETEASPEITEVIEKAKTVESETKVAEKKKPTEMTNEERLRMRAERFGLSLPLAGGREVGGLVKRRQERFGEEPKAKKLAPEPKEMDEKMKARLERFKMK